MTTLANPAVALQDTLLLSRCRIPQPIPAIGPVSHDSHFAALFARQAHWRSANERGRPDFVTLGQSSLRSRYRSRYRSRNQKPSCPTQRVTLLVSTECVVGTGTGTPMGNTQVTSGPIVTSGNPHTAQRPGR